MKRTIVYIDGYNLYYGMLKGTSYKWLDLSAFSKSLLNASHEIIAVKYFSAPIKTHPHDPAAIERQNIYLHPLSPSPSSLPLLRARPRLAQGLARNLELHLADRRMNRQLLAKKV